MAHDEDFPAMLADAFRAREAYERTRRDLLENPRSPEVRGWATEAGARVLCMQHEAAKAFRAAVSIPDDGLSPGESVRKSVLVDDTIELCEALQVPMAMILEELGMKAE